MAEPVYTYYRSSTQNALWGFAVGLLLLLGFILWIIVLVQYPRLALSNVVNSWLLIYLFLAIAVWLVCGVQIIIALTEPYRYRVQLDADRLVSAYESREKREVIEIPLDQVKAVREYRTSFLIPRIRFFRFVDHTDTELEFPGLDQEPVQILLENLPRLKPEIVYEVAELSGQIIDEDGQISNLVEPVVTKPWPVPYGLEGAEAINPVHGAIYSYSRSSLRALAFLLLSGILVIAVVGGVMLLAANAKSTGVLNWILQGGFVVVCVAGVLMELIIGSMIWKRLNSPYRYDFVLTADRLQIRWKSRSLSTAMCLVDLQLDQISTLRIFRSSKSYIYHLECISPSGEVVEITGHYQKPLQVFLEKLPQLQPNVVLETMQVTLIEEKREDGGTQSKFVAIPV